MLSLQGKIARILLRSSALNILLGPSKFNKFFNEYTELTNLSYVFKKSAFHYIETKEPLVFSISISLFITWTPHRRSPGIQISLFGIVHPSKSSWSNPFHMTRQVAGAPAEIIDMYTLLPSHTDTSYLIARIAFMYLWKENINDIRFSSRLSPNPS